MEARGVNESAHRVKQICGQALRFAVAMGLIERDVTADLKGALTVPVRGNYAAITDPKPAAELMRAIYGYHGHAYATAALKLSALLFVRPGELRAAEWREMDLADALWRIPAAMAGAEQALLRAATALASCASAPPSFATPRTRRPIPPEGNPVQNPSLQRNAATHRAV